MTSLDTNPAVVENSTLGLAHPTGRLSTENRDQLVELMPPGWWTEAPCAQADPDAWFPDVGEFAPRDVLVICRSCPVREACLAVALLKEEYGIWAGTTASDRDEIHRLLRAGVSVGTVVEFALASPNGTLRGVATPRVAA